MSHELDDDFGIRVQPGVLCKLHAVVYERIPEFVLKPVFITLSSLGLAQGNNIDKKQREQYHHIVQYYRDVPDEKGAVVPLDAPMGYMY